jgi:NAD(P)-dependent dehydrogenase (short-subunit alcohol dehydrogenase family)
MSEGWAQQLAEFGIGVSVLCPGYVRTRIHESGRTRQDRYGAAHEQGEANKDQRAAMAQVIASGIDPLVVGERVLEAIKADELYIFTHPDMQDAIEARFGAIRTAFEHAKQSEALKSTKQ